MELYCHITLLVARISSSFFLSSHLSCFDKKDERIQELTTELHVKKQSSAAYREQLITVMKDLECQNEHLSSKLQVVSSNLKDLAEKPRDLHHK
ncbi:hypothetical protein LguiB_027284 [Lonicera macranthoides]